VDGSLALETLGYEHEGDLGIAVREAFRAPPTPLCASSIRLSPKLRRVPTAHFIAQPVTLSPFSKPKRVGFWPQAELPDGSGSARFRRSP
jgi:hypothetical protein